MSDTVEKVKKAAKKAYDSVRKPVKSIGKGLEKVAQGKVSEGFGDIGQTAARVGLDVATGGNKDKVDALTGGLMTAAEKAARGNSKDIVRVGATVGALAGGGPGGAMAVNSAFGQGGNVFDAASTFAGSQGFGDIARVADTVTGGAISRNSSLANQFSRQEAASSGPSSIIVPPQPIQKDNTLLIAGGIGGAALLITIILMQKRR